MINGKVKDKLNPILFPRAEGETDEERLARWKLQFKHVVNIYTNIEAYVLTNWADHKQETPMEYVGRVCQISGLTDVGYDIIGSLISNSDRIQLRGRPGEYTLAPKAIDILVLEAS